MTNKKYPLKYKLDAFEQDIEDNYVGTGIITFTETRKNQLEEAARQHVNNRKSITIRVFERDLNRIKFKAEKQALPYQTYINMLLHKDAMSA